MNFPSNNDISREEFNLIRKILREKQDAGIEDNKQLKRKKRKLRKYDTPQENISTPQVIVNLEDEREIIDLESPDVARHELESYDKSTNDSNDIPSDQQDEEEDEEFESDEFEDVEIEDGTLGPAAITDVSFSIDKTNENSESGKKKRTIRNMCSNKERKRRREDHMIYLSMYMITGFIRNQWINNIKLHKRLSKIIPDKVFELLHPEKDEELIIRSERKLLDGLKKTMEIYDKNWKILKGYDKKAFYMRFWDELPNSSFKGKGSKCWRYNTADTLTEKSFVRQIYKGIGDRDLYVQGFIALLRSCQLNARLIFSCQPPDFTNLKEAENESDAFLQREDVIKYPIFWCEVWNKFGKRWITIDPINFKIIESVKTQSKLEPKGIVQTKRNIMRYVIAYDRKYGCRDVTRRYLHWYNCKSRKKRIYKDEEGKIWYDKLLSSLHKRKRTKIDDFEDEYFEDRNSTEGIPDTLSELKNHPIYILETDLRQNEILKSDAKECGYLRKTNLSKKTIKVYKRTDIVILRSPKDWYMKGRVLKQGCRALKKIKKRVTRNRLDDDEDDIERLYPYDDTELYIPPLAKADGQITKNTFGNIEVFTPTMIPKNCVLIENSVAIKACKALHIEFAPAVTGFKFEKGNRVKPIVSGVVVASWFCEATKCAIDGIEYSIEQERVNSEELSALQDWNTLILKLRISSNLNTVYGSVSEKNSEKKRPQSKGHVTAGSDSEVESDGEQLMGGFLYSKNDEVPVYDQELESDSHSEPPMGGFLISKDEKDNSDTELNGKIPAARYPSSNSHEEMSNDDRVEVENGLQKSEDEANASYEEYNDFMAELGS